MTNPSPDDAVPILTAQGVADELAARLAAHHQDPEDVRAAAHARWPDHTEVVDTTVDAHLAGAPVRVSEPAQVGQDVVVDPALHGELAHEPPDLQQAD